MTLLDIAVVIGGLVVGYWVVSKLFFGGPKATRAPPPAAPPPPPSTGPHWYEILEVAPTASEAEIRSAYHHLVSLYHPDKVDTLGQELKDLAIQKMQLITAAYREAMQLRRYR
jgi:DnaJ like chaperone protein